MKQVKVTELARPRRKNNFAGLKEKNFCFVRCSFIVVGSVHFVLLCCSENCRYVTVLLGANFKLSRPPHGSSFRWVKLTKHTRGREQFVTMARTRVGSDQRADKTKDKRLLLWRKRRDFCPLIVNF